MDLQTLKLGFLNYLQSLEENEESKNEKFTQFDDMSDISIFIHAKEFKEYIKKEYSFDEGSISALSVNDILHMEVVNGKLVDPSQGEKGSINNDTDIAEEGAVESEENIEANETEGNNSDLAEQNPEKLTLIDIFNSFLEDENFANEVDDDGNGEFSNKEVTDFINRISAYDGDETSFSIDDLLGAVNDIAMQNELIKENETENTKEIEEIEELDKGNNIEEATSSSPSPSSGSSYPSSRAGSSGYSGGTVYQQPKEKTLDNMTKEELNSELSKAEGDLDKNKTKLSEAISGETPQLIELKNNIDEQKTAYNDALKEFDEDLAEQINDLQTDIDDKKDEINSKELEISDQESTISDCETSYNNAVTYREGLESQLSALMDASSSASSEDKAKIDAQIETVKAQIETAKENETEAKNALDDAKTKLDKLNNDKGILEKGLDELNTQMETLESNITDSEIKTYLTNYKNAQKAYDEEKENELNELKSAVEQSENYVNKVQKALNNCEIKEKEKENLSVISPFAQYNEERGQALANAALKLYGNDHEANGYCASGVADSIQAAFGYRTSGNGCDYGNVLSGLDDWVEVTSEIKSPEELKNLPAGAIVSWSTYEPGHTRSNGQYGHVFISDGQGHEISDYISNVSTVYATWGASYRVFLPR